MDPHSFETIMHPVRMKILLSLSAQKTATTRELSQLHPEIPTATLYRQIARLNKDGVIEVAETHLVNGILEKGYRLKQDLIAELGNSQEPSQILPLFCQFLSAHIADVRSYLQGEDLDFLRDGFGFQYSFLFLNDTQFDGFAQELGQLIKKWEAVPPSPDGRPRRFSTILIPLEQDGVTAGQIDPAKEESQ